VTATSAIISAWACGAVAQYGTPIDSALPVIAVIITIVAAISFPAVQLAVPLLMGGEIVIADERLRLIWLGLVIGVAFGAALLSNLDVPRALILTVCSIVLLRWIIAQRKRTERAVLQAHDELEQRVQERTAQLLNATEALQESEARWRAISELTSDWAYAYRR